MSARRTLWTLYAINFINSIGLWFFLPLLPIYIGRKGGSPALVGVVFAAGLLANALIRYPAGWAADRFGTKAVLVVSMSATALLFFAYILPMPLVAFVALRFLQGAASGAYWPAANGVIAYSSAPADRGRAFGYMQATNLAGMLVGPGIGGLIALLSFGVIFAAAGFASAISVVFLAALRNVHPEETVEVPTHVVEMARRLLPLIMLGAGTAYLIGGYDTIWALYLAYRGANTFAVGLSFMAFALPAVFASGLGGSLGDRLGARRVIVSALIASAFFAALYPLISSVPWLIAMGLPEGASSITGLPMLVAEVSRVSGPHEQGRTQGVFQTTQTAVQIVGALVSGALFTASPTYAFGGIAVVCVLSAATAFVRVPIARASSHPLS